MLRKELILKDDHVETESKTSEPWQLVTPCSNWKQDKQQLYPHYRSILILKDLHE